MYHFTASATKSKQSSDTDHLIDTDHNGEAFALHWKILLAAIIENCTGRRHCGRNIRNTIFCHPTKPQHKIKSKRKQSYYWISIEPHITGSLLTTLDTEEMKENLTLSYNWAAKTHYVHDLKIDDNSPSSYWAGQHHLSHIVHPKFTW